MKNHPIFTLIFIAAVFMFPSHLSAQTPAAHPVLPYTVWVDDDFNSSSPGWQRIRFDRIQDGIDAVAAGGVVNVMRGDYFENVQIDKTLRLLGEDRDSTVIDGTESGNGISILADEVEVRKFTIKNAGSFSCIEISSNNSSAIECTVIGTSMYGILLSSSSCNNVLAENTVLRNSIGMRIEDNSDGNLILKSVFSENNQDILISLSNENRISENVIGSSCYYGIELYHSSKNEIIDNEIHSHTKGIKGSESHNNIIKDNDISKNPYLGAEFYCCDYNEIRGNRFAENFLYGLDLDYSDNNMVINNRFENNENYGLTLNGSTYAVVKNNTFLSNGISLYGQYLDEWNTHTIQNNSANGKPIYYYKDQSGVTVPPDAAQVILASCDNCTMKNLQLADTDCGIQIGFSSFNTVTDNTIRSISAKGIIIRHSSASNHVEGNIVEGCGWIGIEVGANSNNNTVKGNTLSNIESFGICIGSESNLIQGNAVVGNEEGVYLNGAHFNIVKGNLIASNRKGFYGYGITVWKSGDNTFTENIISDNIEGLHVKDTADNNKIYHNSFVLNVLNAYDESSNIWDNGYPSGGNCWEDYTGQDLNGDGIGDSPYQISGGGNQDRYPLMSPPGASALCMDCNTISAAGGGTASFIFYAGAEGAGRDYLLLGSASGTTPGTVLPGGLAVLPLNWDFFTSFVVQNLNTPVFKDFMGTLSTNGLKFAYFDTLGPLSPSLAGVKFNFAYALNKPWNTVSNPVNLVIVP